MKQDDSLSPSSWTHESDPRFTEYYKEASQSEASIARLRSIRDSTARVAGQYNRGKPSLDVADIGCGAGSLSILWAELGHNLHGLDVNEPLLTVARGRAAEKNFNIDFRLGSATALPWDSGSMDVCMLLELLEHVSDWQSCLEECVRVLRPNGVLVVTTSNVLCPKQQEFNLPLYSWYPAPLKHYFERLAVTSRPDLANFAKYPAVHWFSFYGLRRYLAARNFQVKDRFDVMELSEKAAWMRGVVHGIRVSRLLRFLGHVATEGTVVFAIKKSGI